MARLNLLGSFLIVIGGVLFWGWVIYKLISDPKARKRFKDGDY